MTRHNIQHGAVMHKNVPWKDSVRAASTASGTLASAFENGDTLDGVTLATGDRILLKDQSTGSQNGIYVVKASGAPARSLDFDSGTEALGAIIPVREGTVNADKVFMCTTNATITIGSTSLSFSDITGSTGSTPDLSGLTTERVIGGLADVVAGYDASASDARGFPVGHLRLGRGHSVIASECAIAATTDVLEGGVIMQTSGIGTLHSALGMTAGHPGVINSDTGTTTTGRATLLRNSLGSILVNGDRIRFGVCLLIVTLSDGTNRFTLRMGIGSDSTASGGQEIMFRYADNVNSGKWQAVCRNVSVETATDTGITADTNYHTYEWEVNAANNSVEFFIDGVSVAVISSNIPSGAGTSLALIPMNIIKSLGTSPRQVRTDAYWYIFEFGTAR